MPQATRRWISEKVKSLHESDVLPFHELLDVEMVNSALAAEGVSFNERIYTPLGDALPVPLSSPRPRPFMSRRSRAADRLVDDQRPQALLTGD